MPGPSNLQLVCGSFPDRAEDFGALKGVNLLNPNHDELTTLMLIEAERFWNATLLQLFATRELYKTWLYTWGEVALYYAHFFIMGIIS